MDLEGLVLLHSDFGYCKVTTHLDQRVCVRFIGTQRDAWYGVQTIAAQRDFKWGQMPVGLQCRSPDQRICTITEASFQPDETSGVYEYLVVFDGDAGETARLGERDLWPIPGSLVETPLSKLASLQADRLASFRARERLLNAMRQVERESSGIRALSASRISLLPHQAFVIGTVIDDPLWRYILADEVGLGKTIEAGTIAHQLLSEKPDARILILCPGTLTRQWLCEMHLSFGGRSFRLLDLHQPDQISLRASPLLISSLKVAVRNFQAQMLAATWDLVIVDEAHQLLWNDANYALVQQLANQSSRLLLLSAVPARERETELLRLLQLIDPERFKDGCPAATRFSALYSSQATIGRRLRIVSRHLDRDDDLDLDQLKEDVERLLSSDVLKDDADLRSILCSNQDTEQTSDLLSPYRKLIAQIVSRYRISRRILKNRRSNLVAAELLIGVSREVELVPYEASLLEEQISAVALDLLSPLAGNSNSDALQALFRKLAQSLCDPVALYEIANALVAGSDGFLPDSRMFDANAAFDYDEHEALLEACGCVFAPDLDQQDLIQWIGLLRVAIEVAEHPRIAALKACVAKSFGNGVSKILIFAGTYGAAEYVAESLIAEYGKDAVASFRHDMNDDEKEKHVTRFRLDALCRVLVSDESGGEGRNFQFANELIHFDLPWSVSAVEQRIGRLDRIGRNGPVRSYVICPENGIEAAWFSCLDQGFGVFTRSISGLEFMLHATERLIVKTAIENGPSALMEMISSIRETSDRERATDDAEALTDAASFRNSSRYLRASENVGDAMLENAVPYYLRAIGRSEAARRVTDTKDLSLRIWKLCPEEVTDYKLIGLERQGENPLKDCYGTFSRSIARDRPDLDFFAIGHPLVDALSVAANQHVRGRSLVVRVETELVSPGLYLLAGWRVTYFQSGDPIGIPERALRRLYGRVQWTLLDFETGESLDSRVAGTLAKRVVSDTSIAHDLDRDQAIQTFDPVPSRWSELLREFIDLAEGQAAKAYRDSFGESDEAFFERLIANAEEVSRTRLDEGDGYAITLTQTVEAVRNATLGLDVIALLKIEPLAAT